MAILTGETPLPDHDLVMAICTRDPTTSHAKRTLRNIRSQSWPPNSALLLVINKAEASFDKNAILSAAVDFPVPIYIEFEPAAGFATVRNRALEHARICKCILFLDDDTVVESGWIQHMWASHRAHPADFIGSLHARLPSIPESQEDIDAAADQVRGGSLPSLSGTNGLLLPMLVVADSRFDQRYDFTGGEDTEFLLRHSLQGHPERVSSCLALEEDRFIQGNWRNDASFALSRGRLWVTINQNLGQPTTILRFRAALGLVSGVFFLILSLIQSKAMRRRHLRRLAARIGVITA